MSNEHNPLPIPRNMNKHVRVIGNVNYNLDNTLPEIEDGKPRKWWQPRPKHQDSVKISDVAKPVNMKSFMKVKDRIVKEFVRLAAKYGYDAAYIALVECSEAIEPYNLHPELNYRKFK